MIVHNTCWALFVTQAHFASYNLFCPHDNLFLITQMKISEAQTGVATSHSVGVKRQDVNPGNLAAGPKLLVCPHSCSRLISNFTNWSCTHLSNVMERIQFGFFFLCSGRMFFPAQIKYFCFLHWLWLETHLREKAFLWQLCNRKFFLLPSRGGGLELGEAARKFWP